MKSRFAATREPRAFCLVMVSISSLGVSVSCTWYLRHLKMTHPQQHIRDNGTHSPPPHTCRDDGTHPPPPPHVRGTNPQTHASVMVLTPHMQRWWYPPTHTCRDDNTHLPPPPHVGGTHPQTRASMTVLTPNIQRWWDSPHPHTWIMIITLCHRYMDAW